MTDTTLNTPRSRAPQDNDELDIGFFLGSLWDHKIFIAVLTLVFAVGGFIYASLSTPIYQADALVQVEKKGGTIPGADMANVLGGQDLSTSAEIEILRSRMILGQVVNQTNLDVQVNPQTLPVIGDWPLRRGLQRPGFMRGHASVWAGESLTVSELAVSHDSDTLRLMLRSDGQGRYTLLDANERELGQGVAGQKFTLEKPWIELIVSELDAPVGATFIVVKKSRLAAIRGLKARLDVAPRGSGGRQDTGILQLNLRGADQQEIVASLNAITDVFLTQNIARQAAEADKSLAFLESQTPVIYERLTKAEDRLNQFRMETDSIDLSFETQNALNGLVSIEARLSELKLQESELARRFTANHPLYRALLEKKAQLAREKANLEKRTGSLPETQQQILRLNRDVQVTQQIYVQLLNRIQELQLAKAGTVGNVRILDTAVVQGKVAPRSDLIVGISLISGLLLALIIVLLRTAFNRGVVSAEQLEQLDLPVYATIPLSETAAKSPKIRQHKSRQVAAPLAVTNPADLSIEAIRSLRTSLHFAMMEGKDNRLMVCGPSPGVGKSFVSTNLATICAHAGQRVVLVDADMRKGHIHKAFSQSFKNGLADVLVGDVEFEQAVRRSDFDGLSWVSRGSVPPNPSELLMKSRMTEFLDYLSRNFDLVIIDTPPVLAVTDSAILGKQCGTSLMVVRFGINTPKEIQIAETRLARGGVVVKGTILNGIEKKAATSYGYYGYYNYSYKSD
jgi:tyrosine-protein kinase Etk/Wzc